jgi:AGCS family alanine or glycine:cation symporter
MADLSMGFMALINLVAILLLSKFSLAAWKDYSSQLKAGIADPVFKSKSIDGLSEKLSDNAWK